MKDLIRGLTVRFPHSDNNWDLRLGRLECFGSNICIFEIDLLTVLYEFLITDRFFPDPTPCQSMGGIHCTPARANPEGGDTAAVA